MLPFFKKNTVIFAKFTELDETFPGPRGTLFYCPKPVPYGKSGPSFGICQGG